MKAIILAGGQGTRLHPITLEYPKALLTVKKKPIISYLVELFQDQGVEDIIISINQGHRIDFNWWVKRYHQGQHRFVEEKEPLGTFGGLSNAQKYVKDQESFFVTNADEI